MKKYIGIITCAVGTAMLLNSCLGVKVSTASKNVTKDFSIAAPFHAIETWATANVEYTMGDEVKLEITAPDELMQYIIVEEEDGVLKIGHDNLNLKRQLKIGKYNITARVTAPAIDCLKTTGTGDIKADYIKVEKAELLSYGTGDIEVKNLEAGNATLGTYGTGDIEIDGISVKTAEAQTAGTGDIEIKKINASNLRVSTSGTGDITIGGGQVVEGWFSVGGTGDIEAKGLKVENPHIEGDKDNIRL